MKYVYTVWLQNPELKIDDPEREWPACWLIEASTELDAKEWSDQIAKKYSVARKQIFLNSKIELASISELPGLDQLPRLEAGVPAADSEIGW